MVKVQEVRKDSGIRIKVKDVRRGLDFILRGDLLEDD